MKRRILIPAVAFIGALALVEKSAADERGRASAMPGYFDCEIHTILHKDIPEKAAEALAEHNAQVNLLFVFPEDDSVNLMVVDAIQGPGYNPLWQEVEVTWNTTPLSRVLCRPDIRGCRKGGPEPRVHG
jgi:hypothetical protein